MVIDEFHVPWYAAFKFVRAFCEKHVVDRVEVTPGEADELVLLIFHEGKRGRA